MAVQKSRVTRSKRGMRRAHDHAAKPTLTIDSTTGEMHRRHHITTNGYYRGKQVIVPISVEAEESETDKA